MAWTTFGAEAYRVPEGHREVVNLNADWLFQEGDLPGTPQAPGFDDKDWSPVNVPHCFNEPYWMQQHTDFGGMGWYRKELSLRSDWKGRQVFLEFEGVFLHSWVFVNGEFVGEHKGGYSGFTFDITDHVKFGRDNLVAVKVSSEWDPRIAPRAGDFVFLGGIYRDVRLVVTDPLHVTWYGTFVTTPFEGKLIDTDFSAPTSFDEAPVNVKTEIRNAGDSDQACGVKTVVVDAEGAVVAEARSTRTVPAGGTVEFSDDLTVSDPHFWSPSDPYRYTVHTEVYSGDDLVDTFESPLGIRWIQFTARQGFWLNGRHLPLHGFNVHQDHAGWGYAVPNSGFYRDIVLMRDAGANFIRGSHYPKDPALVDACDRYGLCLMQELAYWGRGGGSGQDASPAMDSADFEPFQQNVEDQLREMIRISRNNPSVIAWSLCNEPTGGELATTPLSELANELDPTRATVRVENFSQGEANIHGRNGYYPDQKGYPVMFTELWEKEEERPGSYVGKPDREAFYCLGTARWAGFDYGTHERWEKRLNLVGACDNFRIPKHRYYWHRETWLDIAPPEFPEPGTPARLKIAASKSTIGNDGTDDCQLMVTVLDADGKHISNTIDVKLEIASGPGLFPTGSAIDLNTPDGLAAMSFRSYTPGTTVIRAMADGLTGDEVRITTVPGGIQTYPTPQPWPEKTGLAAQEGAEVGQQKAADASTQERSNPAKNGNDGDLLTRWCAANGSPDQWWSVDLEEVRDVKGVTVTFEQYANYQYVIEVSKDGEAWTLASDQSQNDRSSKTRRISFDPTDARYVRIRYTGLPDGVWASHLEFEVYSEP